MKGTAACCAVPPVLTGKCKVILARPLGRKPLPSATWDQPDGPRLHRPLDYLTRITGLSIYLNYITIIIMEMDFSGNPKGLSKGRGTLKKDYLTKSRRAMLLF